MLILVPNWLVHGCELLRDTGEEVLIDITVNVDMNKMSMTIGHSSSQSHLHSRANILLPTYGKVKWHKLEQV